jgi:succinyl-diaminopimelate desuccinylase
MKALLAIEKYTLKHKKHKLFSKPTINLGLIEGGDAPNMVPSVAKAVLDIRYLPSQSPRKIVQEIKKVVSGHKFVEVKQLLSIPPTEIKGNSELVKVIKKTTKKVLGFTPKTVGLSGATDAKALILKGIPAVGFSCGEHDQMHVPNESIKIKELGDFSKVLFEVVRGFLK